MALEYTYYGAADLTTDQLRSMVAAALAGDITPDGWVVREGLTAMPYRVDPGEEASAPPLFGFSHRITVRFRFSNLQRELEEHNTALMVAAVLAIIDRTGADSVLLFNGEEAILRSIDGEVVFAEDWEGWEDYPEAGPLLEGHRVEKLPQPLLP
jgi:hypothetical protein